MKTALLFTDNATIKKLFALSLEKKGIELKEGDIEKGIDDISDVDIVFIDNAVYSDEIVNNLPNSITKVLIML